MRPPDRSAEEACAGLACHAEVCVVYCRNIGPPSQQPSRGGRLLRAVLGHRRHAQSSPTVGQTETLRLVRSRQNTCWCYCKPRDLAANQSTVSFATWEPSHLLLLSRRCSKRFKASAGEASASRCRGVEPGRQCFPGPRGNSLSVGRSYIVWRRLVGVRKRHLSS